MDDRDFFERLVIIVSTDDALTKAHVRFLEGQLIRLVREAGSVSLANTTQPDFQLRGGLAACDCALAQR